MPWSALILFRRHLPKAFQSILRGPGWSTPALNMVLLIYRFGVGVGWGWLFPAYPMEPLPPDLLAYTQVHFPPPSSTPTFFQSREWWKRWHLLKSRGQRLAPCLRSQKACRWLHRRLWCFSFSVDKLNFFSKPRQSPECAGISTLLRGSPFFACNLIGNSATWVC